ncbi:cellulose-binding domain-containing protein [Lentzea alba]|uniref:cellulose binding domain-containing protein n=1 Tax=Lentzea alba TaxID=2714351 RepID=UPI0039BEF9CB
MRLLGRYPFGLCAFATLLAVAACTTGAADTPPPADSGSAEQDVTVVAPPPDQVAEVVDARTVLLSNGIEARILGLAAPGECYSAAAVKFAQDTLLGKQVRYSRASETAISLRLGNNDDYAALAVSKGAIRAEQNDPVLTELEKTAETSRLGLWGPPCIGQNTTPTSTTTTTTTTPPPATTTTTPPPPPAPPVTNRDCAVDYRVLGSGNGVFYAEVALRNTSRIAIEQWALRWQFPGGQRVVQASGAAVQQHAAEVLVQDSNQGASLNSGASVRFQFAASGSPVTPGSFAVHGRPCSTG